MERARFGVRATPLPQFPKPELQINPQIDLADLRARESAQLKTYGWVDKGSGVVRIPIARAMELIAERGLEEGQPTNSQTGKSTLELMHERPLERDKESK